VVSEIVSPGDDIIVPPLSEVGIGNPARGDIIVVVSSVSNLLKPVIIPVHECVASPARVLLDSHVVDVLVSVDAARVLGVPEFTSLGEQ